MKLPIADLFVAAIPLSVVRYLGGRPLDRTGFGDWADHLELLAEMRRRHATWFQSTHVDVDRLPVGAAWGIPGGEPIPAALMTQLYDLCGLGEVAPVPAGPDADCPECKGTGEYRGLFVIEPCRTCAVPVAQTS